MTQHDCLLLVLLCCTICWQSTMAVEQDCPHSIAEACAAVAAAGPDEWVAERAAVAGRVPVVIMHWTMQDCAHCLALPPFLRLAIQTAVSAGNHVVLVGDEVSRSLRGENVTWVPMSALAAAARPLDDVYQHASSNAENYERGCMQRPFLLLALVRLLDVRRIVHLDSDVLLLISVERWLANLESEGRGKEWSTDQLQGHWLRPRQT